MNKMFRFSILAITLIGLLAAVALRPAPPVSAACTNSGDYPTGILADSPIVYYRMGDAGNPAVNSGSLGAAVNGTYTNATFGATSLVANDANTAVNFNGTNSLVAIPDNASINTGGPYQNRTIEFIFGAGDTVGRQLLWEEGGFTRGLNIYLQDTTLYLGGWNVNNDDAGASSPWGPSFITTTISANTVYHVALVMQGSAAGFTGTLTGYVNGVQIGQATGIGRLFAHTDDTGIARTSGGTRYHNSAANDTTANFFNGRIDEFAMYNAALTSGQINAHITDCFGPLAVSLSGQGIGQPAAVLPWLILLTTSMAVVSLIALRRRPTA
ncbi:MAG: LamG domain-containing protein [Chloroflexi bacterium]|nr:LamG domain-containing protein [Chloroflexota bacterium]